LAQQQRVDSSKLERDWAWVQSPGLSATLGAALARAAALQKLSTQRSTEKLELQQRRVQAYGVQVRLLFSECTVLMGDNNDIHLCRKLRATSNVGKTV
jgi:hypothetical protein